MTPANSNSLFTRQKIFVHAFPEKAWQIHCNIPNWKNWHPDIDESSLTDSFEVESGFTWHYRHLNFYGIFKKISPHAEVEWNSSCLGIDLSHKWFFEPLNNGTLITCEEQLSGWPTVIMRRLTAAAMQNFVEIWFTHLKAEAEKNMAD